MKTKIGMIGLGGRGMEVLRILAEMEEADVLAVCDLFEDRAKSAADLVTEKQGVRPAELTDYQQILNRKDVDAVIICASWEAHVDLAVAAMRAGKAVGLEIGGAYTLKDCWKLVDAWEENRVPFMFLENCCYDKGELRALSMARKGMFGDIVHCSGAYSHYLADEILSGDKNRHYRLRNYLNRNCENYPTHELGPIAKLLNINCGNRMVSLVSVASRAAGLESYVAAHKDAVDQNLIGKRFKQGDIVHTLITTANGETILLKLDTTLPNWYDRELIVRGTKGLYNAVCDCVYLDKKGNGDEKDYMRESVSEYDEYLPEIWKTITDKELQSTHGGMDDFMLRDFIARLQSGAEMPIDVYDAASWMCVTCLSEISVRNNGAPVEIPDFTRGRWIQRNNIDVIDF